MSSRTIHARALLVAAAFALLGVASIAMYAKKLRQEISGGERVAVLILSKEVKRSEPIREDDLAVREIPVAYIDDRFIRASDRPKVLGLRPDRDLDAQAVLEWHDLALSGNRERFLSNLVPPGSRALTLHIPAQYMSIELIHPGDTVDIIGVLDEGRGTHQAIVLLQRVLVLAVGAETTPTHEGRTKTREDQLLTISVTLQESQVVALAAQKGPVIAVLRGPGDQLVASKVPIVSRITPRDPTPVPIVAPKDLRPKAIDGQPGAF